MNQANPSNNNSKLIRVGIIGIIIIVGLTVFLLTDQSRQTALTNFFLSPSASTPSTNSPSASEKPSKIKDWHTYNNSKYGVSLQYPKEYRLFELGQLVTFQTPSENNLDIYIFSDESVTITDYLKKTDEAAQIGYEGKPSFEIRSTKEISINGQNCVQREEHVLAADLQRTITYCLNNSTVVALAFIPTPGKVFEADESIYQQLLSTLVFSK